jgi:hypothetical protein
MADHAPRCRLAVHLLLMLAFGLPCLVVGCGGEDRDKPAPISAEQGKKTQAYMANYGQQMRELNKSKAKATAAEKPSP